MAFFQHQRNIINNNNCRCQNNSLGEISMAVGPTGISNIAIGYASMYFLTTGFDNIAIGNLALYNHITGNNGIAIGACAGGTANVFNSSVGLGSCSYGKGFSQCAACDVVAIGACAGALCVGVAHQNVLIGVAAGYSLTTGCNNVIIGTCAGYSLTTGINNTIIGNLCAAAMVGCSGTLYIAWGNNGASAPDGYIEGESTGISLGNTSPAAALHVTGEIVATLDITAFYSDRRLKDNIIIIDCALDKIKNLTGVKYNRNNLAKSLGFENEKTQLGLLADEVEKVLPEAVNLAPFDTDSNKQSISGENYLTVKYERIIPLLIEGIKDLNAKIHTLENKLTEMI